MEQRQHGRAGNFTAADRAVVIELVQKHWNVIECKRSDDVSVKEKASRWQLVMDEFNAVSAVKRTTQQLKQVLCKTSHNVYSVLQVLLNCILRQVVPMGYCMLREGM